MNKSFERFHYRLIYVVGFGLAFMSGRIGYQFFMDDGDWPFIFIAIIMAIFALIFINMAYTKIRQSYNEEKKAYCDYCNGDQLSDCCTKYLDDQGRCSECGQLAKNKCGPCFYGNPPFIRKH